MKTLYIYIYIYNTICSLILNELQVTNKKHRKYHSGREAKRWWDKEGEKSKHELKAACETWLSNKANSQLKVA